MLKGLAILALPRDLRHLLVANRSCVQGLKRTDFKGWALLASAKFYAVTEGIQHAVNREQGHVSKLHMRS